MIDPLAAVLAYLGTDSDLNQQTSQRLAARHKFGMPTTANAWPSGSRALQVQLVSGDTPDIDTPRQLVRFEARCYGSSQQDAMKVYMALVGVTRRFQRTSVDTGNGRALIYYLVMDASPAPLQDPDTGTEMILTYLRAAVAEEAITVS